MCVRLPGGHFEGAVADDIFRACPVFAVFFDDVPGHGVGADVGEHVEEVGRRGFEFDEKGVVVCGFGAELAGVFDVAFGDGFSVLDGVEQEAVFAAGSGVNVALPGVHDIVRGKRGTVRPGGVAQVEGVGFTICRDVPFFSDTGDDGGVFAACGEPFEDVALDVGL